MSCRALTTMQIGTRSVVHWMVAIVVVLALCSSLVTVTTKHTKEGWVDSSPCAGRPCEVLACELDKQVELLSDTLDGLKGYVENQMEKMEGFGTQEQCSPPIDTTRGDFNTKYNRVTRKFNEILSEVESNNDKEDESSKQESETLKALRFKL